MNICKVFVVDRPTTVANEPETIEKYEQVDFILSHRFTNIIDGSIFFLSAIRLVPLFQIFDFDGETSVRPIQEEVDGLMVIFLQDNEIFRGEFTCACDGFKTELRLDEMIEVEIGEIYQIVIKLNQPNNGPSLSCTIQTIQFALTFYKKATAIQQTKKILT